MTQAVEKLDRNNQPVKKRKLRSNVESIDDIEWKRNTKNPIADNAIEDDAFGMTIEFHEKQYEVRSPARKIIKRFMRFREKITSEDLTESESFILDETQERLIENMLPGLVIDDDDALTEQEYDWLGSFCWQYYVYSKKKLNAQAKESFS